MFIGGYQLWDWSKVPIISLLDQELDVPIKPVKSGKFVVITNAVIDGVNLPDAVIDASQDTFDVYGLRFTYNDGKLTHTSIPTPYEPTAATITDVGVVKQAVNITSIADPQEATAAGNATAINAILSALKTAGIMAPDASESVLSQNKRKVNK